MFLEVVRTWKRCVQECDSALSTSRTEGSSYGAILEDSRAFDVLGWDVNQNGRIAFAAPQSSHFGADEKARPPTHLWAKGVQGTEKFG